MEAPLLPSCIVPYNYILLVTMMTCNFQATVFSGMNQEQLQNVLCLCMFSILLLLYICIINNEQTTVFVFQCVYMTRDAFYMMLPCFRFKLMVLPSAFIVHLPHAPSLDISQFRSSPNYKRQDRLGCCFIRSVKSQPK